MDVVKLAQRFPEVTFICGHSGGDWELGVRIVRPHRNVYFEFAGSDPHSGSVDYAVKELGVDRIVWGGHGPSRSYATELGKILDSDLSREDRMKILGATTAALPPPFFREKGRRSSSEAGGEDLHLAGIGAGVRCGVRILFGGRIFPLADSLVAFWHDLGAICWGRLTGVSTEILCARRFAKPDLTNQATITSYETILIERPLGNIWGTLLCLRGSSAGPRIFGHDRPLP